MNPIAFESSHPQVLELNQHAAGLEVSPAEFDAADGVPGWRYELINGVVVVNAAPMPQERGPNEMLGHLLISYRENHPHGKVLDYTLPEHDIHVGNNRRRADRVLWIGLGRQPRIDETPTVAVEFVSAGKRNFLRDYEVKRAEYESVGIVEYWVFNRFERTVTVFHREGSQEVFAEHESFISPLLPGFEFRPTKLFRIADDWESSV